MRSSDRAIASGTACGRPLRFANLRPGRYRFEVTEAGGLAAL